ncbi:MAG: hypothetical protein QM775_07095 [Pirellulales bacterium]
MLRDVSERRRLLLGGLTAAVIALATSGLWYARAYAYRGDPIYPFLSTTASSNDGSPTAAGPKRFPESKAPLGRTPAAWILAPWQMTMQPERFGGRGHQLGPLWLMLLPIAATLTTPQRRGADCR